MYIVTKKHEQGIICVAYRMVLIPMTLSDFEGHFNYLKSYTSENIAHTLGCLRTNRRAYLACRIEAERLHKVTCQAVTYVEKVATSQKPYKIHTLYYYRYSNRK